MKHFALSLVLLLTACEGTTGGADGGDGGADPLRDGGARPTVTQGLFVRTAGWPSGEPAVGVATVDGIAYVAAPSGVFGITVGEATFSPVALGLTGGEAVTSILRVDQTVAVTLASATGGALLVRPPGGSFARVATPPAGRLWSLARRGTEYFVASTAGFFAATSLDGPWTKRTVTTPPFFAQVTHLVAGTGQQRLFASGDAGAGLGRLFISDDGGRTWRDGPVTGDVRAIAGEGPVVVVDTASGQHRSDNYGSTFRPLLVGAPVNAFLFAASRLWAATATGLRSSRDQGLTFADDLQGLPSGAEARRASASGSVLLVDTAAGPAIGVPLD